MGATHYSLRSLTQISTGIGHHKVYATCMLAYVMRSLRDREQLQRALGTQAGFLPGRSALLNCFALQHMVHHQLHVAKQPLYAVLMDVKGAYDTVRYDHLLQALVDRFVLPPDMVAPLVGMYAGLQYAVLYGGKLPCLCLSALE